MVWEGSKSFNDSGMGTFTEYKGEYCSPSYSPLALSQARAVGSPGEGGTSNGRFPEWEQAPHRVPSRDANSRKGGRESKLERVYQQHAGSLIERTPYSPPKGTMGAQRPKERHGATLTIAIVEKIH